MPPGSKGQTDVPYACVGTVKAGIFYQASDWGNDFISQYPQVDFLADHLIAVNQTLELIAGIYQVCLCLERFYVRLCIY